jgi:hypothetical protein
LTYLWWLSLLLLSHHVLLKFLRDSSKDCKNTGFDFPNRINSSQLLSTSISDLKNNSPLLYHTQLNYWKRQAIIFNHSCIKHHKIQLVKFSIYPHEIRSIIRSTIVTTELEIQNTYEETILPQSRILQASDT